MSKIFKFGKLREEIGKKFTDNDQFADAMDFNPSTLSKKLNGGSDWKRAEIEKACELLNIPMEKVHEYFFYT